MNIGIEFIINKIKEYSQIPSLTYQEDKFLDYLVKEIPTEHYTLDDETSDYLLYRNNGETQWLILAHTDRIKVPRFTFRVTDKTIHGQLDNVISVAICRYLMELGTPVDFMFTTREETCQSAQQIIDVWSQKQDYKILDMDIDVLHDKDDTKEVDYGMISLRDRDSLAVYDQELVKEVRGIADRNDIEYVTKDGHWLIAQPGTVLKDNNMVKIMYLGIVIDNYHSNKEYVTFKAIENMVKLVEGI